MRQRSASSAHRPAGLPAYCPARSPRRSLNLTSSPRPRGRRNARGEKLVTVARLFDATATGNDPTLPMIRLRGQWLQRLGFEAGDQFAVTEERGRIVLRLASDEER